MKISVRKEFPRLPLDGSLDLTYRCNNTCLHCWLWESPEASIGREELSFDEIVRVVNEARQMGCRVWGISGGEPMLRPDFAEIFEYITRKTISYRLNTNGTLITPEIARLMKRKGRKMVALYGATAEVHDHVTRSPGSFEATLRGFAYLKEAGARFEVQIVPMKANYHQHSQMLELAESLSPHYRIGAAWLFLSACGSAARNSEIMRQRLEPGEVLVLDPPAVAYEAAQALENLEAPPALDCPPSNHQDDRLFAGCIHSRSNFHIDPYGGMSFCSFIKDPALRYNLRQGTFQQAWDEFIPALADVVHGGQEYLENCASCDMATHCRWCGVYGYLEQGRFSAKVEYLCQVAQEVKRYKETWKLDHLRYYQIAGITIQLTTSFPMTESTFHPKFQAFQVDGPGEDNISIQLAAPIPPNSKLQLGTEFYRKPPWAVYRRSHALTYLGITSEGQDGVAFCMMILNEDHSRGTIYRSQEFFEKGGIGSLTTLPTDQILLARVLADRQGCFIHSSAISMDGQGLMFVGHSEAGKSTTLKMLREYGEILCDDRNIIRRWPDGFKVHGTWSHGELPDISPTAAPLKAILYLEKAGTNQLLPITNKMERIKIVLSHVIKPLVDAGWWQKTLDLAEHAADEVPFYRLRFDKSGQVREVLQALLNG
jgi:MoaA/NifB/PqqE/SkfB family radical SAM enzyme